MTVLGRYIAAALIATAIPATASVADRYQPISWDGVTLQVPASWVITYNGDHLSAENPLGSETLEVTHLVPAPHYLALRPSPSDILQNQIDHLSPVDMKSPETYIIRPYRKFELPCGEPAAFIVHGLGDDEFSISFDVASTNSLYTINFYQTGNPLDRLGFYQALVNSARADDFEGSRCKDEV